MTTPTPEYLASVAARAEREQLLADAGITTHPDTSQTWTTLHGDTATVWQAAPYGRPLDWRWNIRAAGNHEVVGQGEGHTRRHAAREAAMRHHPAVDPAGPSDSDVAAVRRFVAFLRDRDCTIAHRDHLIDGTAFETTHGQLASALTHWTATERGEDPS